MLHQSWPQPCITVLSSNAQHAVAGLARTHHAQLAPDASPVPCCSDAFTYTVFRYKALEEQCNIDKEKRYVVTIDGHEDVPGFDEGALVKVG